MSALAAGMPAFAQDITTLDPDTPLTRVLHSEDVHLFRSSISGDVRIVVEHPGRGTILTACRESCADDENVLLRSATWRGPEHFYSAVLSIDEDTVLEIVPDEGIAPAGDYRITLRRFSRDVPSYAGELAMTLGADRHLQHYFGEADAREDAAAFFEAAAESFATAGNWRRQADALFEGGVVLYLLGRNLRAYESFLEAEAIWQMLGDERGLAASENQRGLIVQRLAGNVTAGTTASAAELFERAAERRRRLGDDFYYAQAVNNLGLVYQELGDGRLARRYFEEALSSWQGSVDLMAVDPGTVDFSTAEREPWLFHALVAMTNLGWAYDHSAMPDLAERHYEQAIALAGFLERGEMRARIRNNYGELMYRIGRLQNALSLLQESLVYFESAAGNETWSAEVHNNLGLVYAAAGDAERARASFEEALRLRTEERDPVGRAESLRNIALLSLEAGDPSATLATVDEALAILGKTPAARTERAGLQVLAGRALVQSGRVEEALDRYDRSLELYRGMARLAGEANARANRAYAYHAAARDIPALAEFDVALDIARQIESLGDQFRILTQLARVRFNRREYDLAYEDATEAIALSERLRERLVHPSLLREYASVQQDAYDVLINAAVEAGRLEVAWQAADRARARRFIELLRESGAALATLEPAVRERYELLRARVALLAGQRSEYLARNDVERAAGVRRELIPLLNEMDALSIDVGSAVGPDATPVELRDVQAVLGPADLMLEYYVSPLGAGVWRIDAGSIGYDRLPGHATIRSSVAALRHALQDGASSSDASIRDLSALLFDGSAGPDDGADHLIVIPDGPLHMIPFAVLSDPASGVGAPLIVSRDITYLPSAAALLELRRRDDTDGEGIAVLADPVFEASDPRVSAGNEAAEERQLAMLLPELRRGGQFPDRFQRLPGTRDESRAIRESAGDTAVRIVLDTEANRDTVLSGVLDDYRILHFATHGVLDAEEPALSGLVLSAVTEDGRSRPPFLLTQDIVSMELKAELVVLSGCDTGIGRPVRGEGLISLSRAFFYAGAEQVISSLWQVPDRATAELMGHFYRRLLQDGESPASALRNAQLTIMKDRRWRSPYYWAAFILQGDWTGGASYSASAAAAGVAKLGNE